MKFANSPWFKALKSTHFNIFVVLYASKPNIFGFCNVKLNKILEETFFRIVWHLDPTNEY